jgi:hypothetical protein
MHTFLRLFKNAIKHPIASGAISLLLFLGALMETASTFESDMKDTTLRAHHGLLVFAVVQLLASVADVLDGLLEISEGDEEAHGGEE